MATLCEALLNSNITTIYLKLNDEHVERSFDRKDGVPFITCFDYPKIAYVLYACRHAFWTMTTEGNQFDQLLEEVDGVIDDRAALHEWYENELPSGDRRKEDNIRYEAFLNVMMEVRRILNGWPA